MFSAILGAERALPSGKLKDYPVHTEFGISILSGMMDHFSCGKFMNGFRRFFFRQKLAVRLSSMLMAAMVLGANADGDTGSTNFMNPIISGYYPDPSICRVGDDYYTVHSTFEYFPGVPIFHSGTWCIGSRLGTCSRARVN